MLIYFELGLGSLHAFNEGSVGQGAKYFQSYVLATKVYHLACVEPYTCVQGATPTWFE